MPGRCGDERDLAQASRRPGWPTAGGVEAAVAGRRPFWNLSQPIGCSLRRTYRLPVVLVNVAGIPPGRTEQVRHLGDFPTRWTDLIPELSRQPTDHCITKYTAGAFAKTGLEEHLLSQGVTQVVLAEVWRIPVQSRWGNLRLANKLILDWRSFDPTTTQVRDYLKSKGTDVTTIDLGAK